MILLRDELVINIPKRNPMLLEAKTFKFNKIWKIYWKYQFQATINRYVIDINIV